MKIIIAEKPSQGRALAEALGVRGRGNGFLGGGDIAITWCIGHLVELAPPETYNPTWARWSLSSLPMIPTEFKTRPTKGTWAQFQVVKELLLRKEVTEVICATDAGREGELIFDLVYRAAGCKKPVKRLWTASLTPEAIREAYAHLRPAEDFVGLRHAAHCRSQADWLVGINATRAQTLQAQAGGGQGVWPVGRVQTPTLAMLAERENAIRSFVSKPFWFLEALFEAVEGGYKGRWFAYENGKITQQIWTREQAEEVLARVQNRAAVIESVTGTQERHPPEQLFDLTALQREGNRRYGFSADKTLQLAQSLYEKGVLSYPRTNSRYLTPAEVPQLPRVLAALPEIYQPFVAQTKARPLGKRFVDAAKVEDHHAIIPTGKRTDLAREEGLVFDLVARRLIAAYFPDEVAQKTVIVTAIGDEKFRTIGRVVLEPGWTKVEGRGEPSKAEEEKKNLPLVKQGEAPRIEKLDLGEGQTQPPKPLTESDLLGAMETAGKRLESDSLREAMKDCGLGTPATRAAVIEGLLLRELIQRNGKTLVPTEKGLALIASLKADALKSPELTGQWEAKLEKVRRRELSAEEFMSDVRRYTEEIVGQIKAHTVACGDGAKRPATPSLGDCPKCKSPLSLRFWKGKYYVKCTATKDAECKTSYDCDREGKPKGGLCVKCQAPMKVTKAGSRVCTSCGTWGSATKKRAPRAASKTTEKKPRAPRARVPKS